MVQRNHLLSNTRVQEIISELVKMSNLHKLDQPDRSIFMTDKNENTIALGKELAHIGGIELMRTVLYAAAREFKYHSDASLLEYAWHNISDDNGYVWLA